MRKRPEQQARLALEKLVITYIGELHRWLYRKVPNPETTTKTSFISQHTSHTSHTTHPIFRFVASASSCCSSDEVRSDPGAPYPYLHQFRHTYMCISRKCLSTCGSPKGQYNSGSPNHTAHTICTYHASRMASAFDPRACSILPIPEEGG